MFSSAIIGQNLWATAGGLELDSSTSVNFAPRLESATINKATTMHRIPSKLQAFATNDAGSSAVEYAVIAVVITTSFVSVVANFAPALSGLLEYVGQHMNNATAAAN
jgi:Flp pilus assembly pilin Flp